MDIKEDQEYTTFLSSLYFIKNGLIAWLQISRIKLLIIYNILPQLT
jgi:hypothetical protein